MFEIGKSIFNLKQNQKGQGTPAVIIGGVVTLIVVGIGQLVTSNVLKTANIYSGLWTLSDTLFPVVGILVLLGIAAGAFFAFSR